MTQLWSDLDPSTSSCRQNHSYFTTASFMVTSYNILSLINIPLSMVAFYAIARKTPKGMKKMKSALLFSQFCSTNLDICVTLLGCPYAFFPSVSGLALGILSRFGVPMMWQAYWGQVSITMNGVAFVMLYENRQSQISTIRWKIKSEPIRRVYCLVLIVLAFLSMLPFYLEKTNQVELRKVTLERIPCPVIEFFDPGTYVLLKGGESAPFYTVTAMTLYIMFQSTCFAIHVIYHTVLVQNANLSKETRKMQRKFLGYITLQISIPMIAIIFPTAYSFYADKNNYYNQAYNNFAILAFASHGILATSTTLIIYKPYRDFVIRAWRRGPEVSVQSSATEVFD